MKPVEFGKRLTLWIKQNLLLAARSTNGTFVLAQESSHYLHEDALEVVMEAIREMIATR